MNQTKKLAKWHERGDIQEIHYTTIMGIDFCIYRDRLQYNNSDSRTYYFDSNVFKIVREDLHTNILKMAKQLAICKIYQRIKKQLSPNVEILEELSFNSRGLQDNEHMKGE